MYNYRGYNNITYLGGEVKSPAKNIPRAIVGDSSPLRHVAVSSSRPGGACRVDLRRNHARAAPVSRHRCCPLVVGIGGVLASGASGQVVAICPCREPLHGHGLRVVSKLPLQPAEISSLICAIRL
jgi:amino acid transporter